MEVPAEDQSNVRHERAIGKLQAARTAICGAVLALSALSPRQPLRAQIASRLGLGGMIEVGGEEERYLRVLQVAGRAPLVPWSIRPFSPDQDRRLRVGGAHPWRQRFDSGAVVPMSVSVLRPEARLIGNSSYPFQDGGGPTWAGRGLTLEGQAGFAVGAPSVTLQVAPVAFVAQNSAFALAPNNLSGSLRFADPRYPLNIDAPQRFGDRSYSRLAPGTSALVFDAVNLVASVTSAPQAWGPAREYPLVLGPNAGGFPALYVGTSQPLNLWIAGINARVVYGKLTQTAYADTAITIPDRLASGVVGTILPRGLPGLEIGGSRFSHRPWEGTPPLSVLLRPFSGFISNNQPGSNLNEAFENEMGSIFARWVFPSAKAEFYGEMYKEDFFGGFHVAASTLVEKPDDYSAFALGFQRVMTSTNQTIVVVRGELVNAETSHQERGQRGFAYPLPPYIHGGEFQGHTEDGLILGSPEAYGGAGWRLGVDRYSPAGRESLTLERALRFDWLPTQPIGATDVHPDVIYAVRGEMLRFIGRREWALNVIPSIDLNRNLVAHHNVFNLTTSITVRGW